jgi:hypothetical protein
MLEHGRIAAGEKAVEHTWSMIGTEADPRVAFWHNGSILADLAYRTACCTGSGFCTKRCRLCCFRLTRQQSLQPSWSNYRTPRLGEIVRQSRHAQQHDCVDGFCR